MNQADTIGRIMDTAERLFAEKGFSHTSLRTITRQARVNLASVNYHFGSKDILAQAVFARFLASLLPRLESHLQQIENSTRAPDAQQLIAFVLSEVIAGRPVDKQDSDAFIRLLTWAYTQERGELLRYLHNTCENLLSRYLEALGRAVPDLSPSEVRWRVHFLMGAIFFTVAHFDTVRSVLDAGRAPGTTSLEQVLQELVPSLAKGMFLSPPGCAGDWSLCPSSSM